MPDLRKPGMADEEPYMDVLVGVSGSDIYTWPAPERLANQ